MMGPGHFFVMKTHQQANAEFVDRSVSSEQNTRPAFPDRFFSWGHEKGSKCACHVTCHTGAGGWRVAKGKRPYKMANRFRGKVMITSYSLP